MTTEFEIQLNKREFTWVTAKHFPYIRRKNTIVLLPTAFSVIKNHVSTLIQCTSDDLVSYLVTLNRYDSPSRTICNAISHTEQNFNAYVIYVWTWTASAKTMCMMRTVDYLGVSRNPNVRTQWTYTYTNNQFSCIHYFG